MRLLTIVNNNHGTNHILYTSLNVDTQNNFLEITTWNNKKMFFVISNIKCFWSEPASQAQIDYFERCEEIKKKGINEGIRSEMFEDLLNGGI